MGSDMLTLTAAVAQYLPVTELRVILTLIVLNVLTAVLASLRLRAFEPRALGDFYITKVIPMMGGYILVYMTLASARGIVPAEGLGSWLGTILLGLADIAAPTAIVLPLAARIKDALEVIFSDDPQPDPRAAILITVEDRTRFAPTGLASADEAAKALAGMGWEADELLRALGGTAPGAAGAPPAEGGLYHDPEKEP